MSRDDHYRKLERLYLGAPTNAYYRPSIQIGEGRAEIEIAVRPEFMHAAKAVHGSVYFKLLDDACFFAVNSLVEDVFVLTTSFNLYLSRPVSQGTMRASGRIVHRSKRTFLAEGEAVDGEGRPIARGGGIFMRSEIRLGPEVGYE
jgi:uncharacterized protein (TIGR00369 family)